MRSNAIRWIAGFMVVLALVLAVIAYRYGHSFAENRQAQAADSAKSQSAVPQTLVVVAVKPLALDKAVERDAVALVPVQVAPAEFYTNVEDVVGKKPMIDVDAGTPVTPRLFKGVSVIARRIPAGYRALSLKVDDVVGTGGFIRPGDIVDVLLYIRSVSDTPTGANGKSSDSKDSKRDIATQARFLLKDVTVLAYEDHVVDPPKGLDDKDKQQQQNAQRRERTAVVAVPENEVTRVMLGASLGELRLALHPQLTDVASTAPTATPTTPASPPSPSAPDTTGLPPGTTSGAAPSTTATPQGVSPATSTAGVSAIQDPNAAGPTSVNPSASTPVLPLSEAEKAKAEAAKVPDEAITAVELGRVKPAPEAEKKKKAAARPRVQSYRGTTRSQSTYP